MIEEPEYTFSSSNIAPQIEKNEEVVPKKIEIGSRMSIITEEDSDCSIDDFIGRIQVTSGICSAMELSPTKPIIRIRPCEQIRSM